METITADGLEAALRFVADLEAGKEKTQELVVKELPSLPGRRNYAVVMGSEVIEKELSLPAPNRGHVFSSVEGLVDYLNSEHCAGVSGGIAFVQPEGVLVDLAYGEHRQWRCTLPLVDSEEMVGLKVLMKGCGQKTLWRELRTRLAGCVSEELLLQISQVRVAEKEDALVDIDPTGITGASVGRTIALSFSAPRGEGSVSAVIGLDWVFTGRVWEAFDVDVEIPLTLELSKPKDSPLIFTFHPRRLQGVVLGQCEALAGWLGEKVPVERVTVHEGSY